MTLTLQGDSPDKALRRETAIALVKEYTGLGRQLLLLWSTLLTLTAVLCNAAFRVSEGRGQLAVEAISDSLRLTLERSKLELRPALIPFVLEHVDRHAFLRPSSSVALEEQERIANQLVDSLNTLHRSWLQYETTVLGTSAVVDLRVALPLWPFLVATCLGYMAILGARRRVVSHLADSLKLDSADLVPWPQSAPGTPVIRPFHSEPTIFAIKAAAMAVIVLNSWLAYATSQLAVGLRVGAGAGEEALASFFLLVAAAYYYSVFLSIYVYRICSRITRDTPEAKGVTAALVSAIPNAVKYVRSRMPIRLSRVAGSSLVWLSLLSPLVLVGPCTPKPRDGEELFTGVGVWPTDDPFLGGGLTAPSRVLYGFVLVSSALAVLVHARKTRLSRAVTVAADFGSCIFLSFVIGTVGFIVPFIHSFLILAISLILVPIWLLRAWRRKEWSSIPERLILSHLPFVPVAPLWCLREPTSGLWGFYLLVPGLLLLAVAAFRSDEAGKHPRRRLRALS